MIERLLSELRQQGVRIRSDGDRVVCDAPPNVMTPELIEQLREHKDQIIEFLNKEPAAAKADDEFVIPTISRTMEIPLSFAQESLWFLDQLNSDTASYNIPIKLRLLGEVDQDVLAAEPERNRAASRDPTHMLPNVGRPTNPGNCSTSDIVGSGCGSD